MKSLQHVSMQQVILAPDQKPYPTFWRFVQNPTDPDSLPVGDWLPEGFLQRLPDFNIPHHLHLERGSTSKQHAAYGVSNQAAVP